MDTNPPLFMDAQNRFVSQLQVIYLKLIAWVFRDQLAIDIYTAMLDTYIVVQVFKSFSSMFWAFRMITTAKQQTGSKDKYVEHHLGYLY